METPVCISRISLRAHDYYVFRERARGRGDCQQGTLLFFSSFFVSAVWSCLLFAFVFWGKSFGCGVIFLESMYKPSTNAHGLMFMCECSCTRRSQYWYDLNG